MEYEALIDRILAAEQTAQEMTREAHEKEARMEADLEQETAEVRADYFAKAEERLEELRRETERSRAQAIAAQDVRFREALDKIERAYSRYGDNWVDTMFRQTVGQRP